MEFFLVIMAFGAFGLGAMLFWKGIKEMIERYFQMKQQHLEVDKRNAKREITAKVVMEDIRNKFNEQKVSIGADILYLPAKSKITYYIGRVALDDFHDVLESHNLFGVAISNFCEIDGEEKQCSVLYKVQTASGNFLYITVRSSYATPEHYEIEEPVLSISGGLEVIYEGEIDPQILDAIAEELKGRALAHREYVLQPLEESSARFFTIGTNFRGMYLKETEFEFATAGACEAYNLSLEVGGKKLRPTSPEVLDVLTHFTKFPVNIGIFGDTGTGKTTLSYQLAGGIYESCVIGLTGRNLLDIAQDSDKMIRFTDLVKEKIGLYENIVIILDEADSILSGEHTNSLNGILDGNLRKSLGNKVSFILIFNKHPKELPQTIVRPGRLHAILECKKLEVKAARELLKSLPVRDTQVKNIEDFEKFVNRERRKEVSLAEVTQFIVEKDVHDILLNIVSGKIPQKGTNIIVPK